MIKAPLLVHPSFDKDFITYSDASKSCLGGILVQVQDYDGKEAVVGYFSRRLSKQEESRSIPERELMAMIETLEYFRPFLFAMKKIY